MKQSEVMRLKTKADIYAFDHQLIKLYPATTTYDRVKGEYDKSKLIESQYSHAIVYDRLASIEDQYGLVFNKMVSC